MDQIPVYKNCFNNAIPSIDTGITILTILIVN